METKLIVQCQPSDDLTTRNVVLRPGKYLHIPNSLPWWEQDRIVHQARLQDMVEECPSTIAVLRSAVLLHGGSLLHSTEQAHVSTSWRGHGATGPGGSYRNLTSLEHRQRLAARRVVHHCYPIDEDDLVLLNGIPATGLRQTVRDAARFLPPDDALAAVDSLTAVALGRDEHWRNRRSEVEAKARAFLGSIIDDLEEFHGQRGVAQAREILRAASPLVESVHESELRRIALSEGFGGIEAQMEIRTDAGVRWADLGIREARVVFEVNGDMKYEGEAGEEQRWSEELRRNAIERSGYTVVDFSTRQLADRALVVRTLDYRASQFRGKPIRQLLTRSERHLA